MRKFRITAGIVFSMSLFVSSVVFAAINTQLVLVGNTHNSPSNGQGTLVIDVEASNTGGTFAVGLYQGSFHLNAILHGQLVGVPTFSQREFAPPQYSSVENYDSGGTRTVQYTYTYQSGDTKSISGSWERIVTVTIIYTMTGDNGSITWASNPEFKVENTGSDDQTGNKESIPTNLQDISLPVELTSLFATYSPDMGVVLKWRTESELSNEGFHVWRSNATDGEYTRITNTLIPGHGDSPFAHDYTFIDRNVDEGVNRWYKIEQIDKDGTVTFYGPIDAKQLSPSNIPKDLALLQNYPNPFNPTTEISYQLPEESTALIKIYNLLGEKLRTLVDQKQSAGTHTVTWNGRDDNGQRLGSGIYFYKLVTGKQVKIRKMLKVE